ncbi:hypothetical protein Q1695_003341 [Nippostrongylus brasiliensis]|nr:hypothetical protein Q1695_003341 [Nippostrongylus brasiliensis]
MFNQLFPNDKSSERPSSTIYRLLNFRQLLSIEISSRRLISIAYSNCALSLYRLGGQLQVYTAVFTIMDSSNDSFERLLLSSDEEEEGCANDEPQAALVKIGSSICDDSSSSDDDDVTLNPPQQLDWRSTFVARETFEFSDENVGILDDTLYEHVNAMQFWRVFLTDAVIQLILTETNRNYRVAMEGQERIADVVNNP